jgi:polar amino acid transport system substrate-binding protein
MTVRTPIGAALPGLLLAAVLLAGCGGNAEPTVAPTAAAPEIGEPATFAPGPEPTATEVVDLGGREIHVGTDATYPPFESTTESGEIVGIDPDLMTAICEVANCQPRFISTDWNGIFAALGAGEFDVLMSAITILPEREAESGATFTTPYFQVGQVILVRSDSTITSIQDLTAAGVAVGVQTGTTGDTAATEGGVPEESMNRFDTNVFAVQALLSGDVDAVVVDNPTADVYVGQHPAELKVAGPPFTTEDYGILVPDDDPDVLHAYNAAIGQLAADGSIDEIVSRWYAQNE